MLATKPPQVFDADAGLTTPAGFGTPFATQVIRVGAGAVVAVSQACAGDTCPPSDVYSYLGDGPPVGLGKALSVAAGADGASVWLIRPDGPDTCSMQHVSLGGTPFDPGQPASCDTGLRGETSAGLLISVNGSAAEHEDVLIDPASGRPVQQFPKILAVTGRWLLAAGLADFTLVDLRDGSRKQIPRPTQSGDADALPNRDGSLIAVTFANLSYQGKNVPTRDLWVLDPATQRWQHAPGTPFVTPNLKRSGLDWSADGDLVLADGVLAAWHPGAPAWRLGKASLPDSDWYGIAVLG